MAYLEEAGKVVRGLVLDRVALLSASHQPLPVEGSACRRGCCPGGGEEQGPPHQRQVGSRL